MSLREKGKRTNERNEHKVQLGKTKNGRGGSGRGRQGARHAPDRALSGVEVDVEAPLAHHAPERARHAPDRARSVGEGIGKAPLAHHAPDRARSAGEGNGKAPRALFAPQLALSVVVGLLGSSAAPFDVRSSAADSFPN